MQRVTSGGAAVAARVVAVGAPPPAVENAGAAAGLRAICSTGSRRVERPNREGLGELQAHALEVRFHESPRRDALNEIRRDDDRPVAGERKPADDTAITVLIERPFSRCAIRAGRDELAGIVRDADAETRRKAG